MARPLRIEYEGACYHLMSRGDRRENIFRDDTDRQAFIDTLGKACAKTGWQVHAFCLMSNHFHLVIETPRPNLCAGMKWLLGTVTMRFNRRHHLVGHLFAGRYKSQIIDERAPAYLKAACDYVHLNPARARILTSEQKLEDYRWSSLRDYLRAPAQRPPWLRTDRVFGEHRIRADDTRGRREFSRRMEATRLLERQSSAEEMTAVSVALRKGWRLGEEDFLERLRERIGESVRTVKHPPGNAQQRWENERQSGEWLIAELLVKEGWDEQKLLHERKGHPVKTTIAAQLRARTALTQEQIATRLHMGTRTHLNFLLQRRAKRVGAP